MSISAGGRSARQWGRYYLVDDLDDIPWEAMAMKQTDRFPYETSPWNSSHSKRWNAALERTGPENVRARLAQTDAGSNAGIAIGIEQTITIGFAQKWLAWHDRRKSEREAEFRRRSVFWTRFAAVAAAVAAGAGGVGWAFNILRGH
jgi:hypothetical protein